MYIGILVVHRVSSSSSRFIVEVRGRANYPLLFLSQACSITLEAELSWLAIPPLSIRAFMTAKYGVADGIGTQQGIARGLRHSIARNNMIFPLNGNCCCHVKEVGIETRRVLVPG